MGPPAIAPQGPTKPTRERLAGRSRARLEGWIGRAPARGWLGVDRDSWESPIEPARQRPGDASEELEHGGQQQRADHERFKVYGAGETDSEPLEHP